MKEIIISMVRLERKCDSIPERYILHYCKRSVKAQIKECFTEKDELFNALKSDYYNLFLKENILQCVKEHSSLWETLEDVTPSQTNLEFLSKQVLLRIKKIESVWQKITELKLYTMKEILLYCMYSSIVLNDEIASSTAVEQYAVY
jgi:hypothetical protein